MELTPEELAALKALAAIGPQLLELVKVEAQPEPAEISLDQAPAVPPAAQAPAVAPIAPVLKADAVSPEAQERMITDSIELREKARHVLGKDFSFQGKTNRAVMSEVISHVDSKFVLVGKSDEAISAVFEMAFARHAERLDSQTELGNVQRATHTDAADADDTAAYSMSAILSQKIAAARAGK